MCSADARVQVWASMLDEQALNVVRQHMWEVRAPTAYDRVYKDECVFSFDTPESPGGLYVNLSTFQAVGEMYLDVDFERNGKHLYLHERAKRVPLTEEQLQEHASKPARMAIGGEGGFQVDAKKYNVEREHALVVMPGRLTIPLPCQELPQVVLDVIAGIKEHDSALVQDNVAMWEEERKVSRFAKSLHQEPAWRKLSPNPRDWKCDLTGATENLWLNLSTGVIGSGRANWDGSGGNGAALRHYEEAGRKYPLVVKLGTITPHGADVFSYDPDEDDMVTDPDLDAHLAHWGINMMQMQKTEKTVAELQIDLNLSFELDRITEANCRLHPISGPRLVGLRNLGNSCYMNSVLQALWMVPDLEARYVQAADQIVRTAPQEPQSDFPVQMAKIGVALLHARTAAPLPVEAAAAAAPQDGQQSSSSVEMGEADENGMADATPASHGKTEEAVTADAEANSVVPRMFKKVVGQGHPEFSTAHQQDAMEYFLHLLEVMQRAERAHASRLGTARLSTSDANFRFQTQDRIVCQRTQAVSYKVNAMTVLELSIPLEASVNQPEVAAYQQREQKRQKLRDESAAAYIPSEEEGAATGVISKDSEEEPVIPQVPAQACLDRWAQTEEMSDYYSAAAGGKVTAVKSTRFKTFPPFLMLAMRRYYVDELWVPRKMEVLVQMPDELDLEYLRAAGPQPEEQLQPEEDPTAGPPGAAAGAGGGGGGGEDSQRPIPDDSIVQQLMAMGFSQNGSRRACVACRNSSVEACMEWVLSHMEDADFNSPLEDAAPAPAAPGETGSAAPQGSASEEQVETLAAMGFSKREAQAALTACSCSLERAVDWLFSHADGLEAAVAQVLAGPGADNGSLSGGTSSAAPEMDDGPGQYRLEAIISHMGSNTGCGHYVCHTKKDGKWVLFNDEKVALSEKPPKDLGYLYLYRRCMEH